MKRSSMEKIIWVLSRLLIPAVFIKLSYRCAEYHVKQWFDADKKNGGAA
jgi:hypothetical protein